MKVALWLTLFLCTTLSRMKLFKCQMRRGLPPDGYGKTYSPAEEQVWIPIKYSGSRASDQNQKDLNPWIYPTKSYWRAVFLGVFIFTMSYALAGLIVLVSLPQESAEETAAADTARDVTKQDISIQLRSPGDHKAEGRLAAALQRFLQRAGMENTEANSTTLRDEEGRVWERVALLSLGGGDEDSREDALLRRVVEAATGLRATELTSKGTAQGDRGTGDGWEVRLPKHMLASGVGGTEGVRLIAWHHVPPYGYGENHGWARIVRVLGPPPTSAGALRNYVRWHCRLSHVAAHTRMLTLQPHPFSSSLALSSTETSGRQAAAHWTRSLLSFIGLATNVEGIETMLLAALRETERDHHLEYDTLLVDTLEEEEHSMQHWPCKPFEAPEGGSEKQEALEPACQETIPWSKCTVPFDICGKATCDPNEK